MYFLLKENANSRALYIRIHVRIRKNNVQDLEEVRKLDVMLSEKKIKEMCGTVSYKKGTSFYRGNKVTIFENTDDYCRALVHGVEEFFVEIFMGDAGKINAKCSCPPILNYNKYCQHIAAVLIALHEQNKQTMITDEFMALFQNRKSRSTSRQYHFETRESVNGHFKLTPITVGEGQVLLGIQVEIENKKVSDLPTFLQGFKQGKKSSITGDFTFDPNLYCFENEVDKVLHELGRFVTNGQAFNFSRNQLNND